MASGGETLDSTIKVDVVAPEPATIVSAGIAGLMALGYNWRARRKRTA